MGSSTRVNAAQVVSLIAARCGHDCAGPWDGAHLAAGLSVAAAWLHAHAERLNALNVYPVPDGDTGTNMSLTLNAAADAAQRSGGSAAAAAAAAARAALLGSRGNSGVILSQCLSGFCRGLGDAERVGAAEVRSGLRAAAEQAYAGVVNPVEGTLLTAAREAAEAATAAQSDAPLALLRAALDGAARSVTLSPERLPRLKEAGVVDAGAEGLRVILEALVAAAEGRSLDPAAIPAPPGGALARARSAHPAAELGYCTEFLVRGVSGDPEDARHALAAVGSSAIVVAEGDSLRVHVHTEHPGTALELALRYGALDRVKVENMEQQHRTHVAAEAAPPAASGAVAVVAVASGAGFAALYRELGALVLDGGPTMNPSVADLAAVLRAAPPGALVLLANNPNVVPAARQAATVSGRAVDILETDSQARGVAALLALGPEDAPADALARMRAAAGRVRVIEVALATRDATVDGLPVRAGSALALLDGRAVAEGRDPVEVALAALGAAEPAGRELLTVYGGADAAPGLVERLVSELGLAYPHLVLETVPGGQPHHPLVLTLE